MEPINAPIPTFVKKSTPAERSAEAIRKRRERDRVRRAPKIPDVIVPPKPEQVSTQSRSPRSTRFTKDPTRHYVLVERGEQFDAYMYKPSLVDPSQPLYDVASEDRGATGSAKMVLLAMSMDDYIQMQATNELEAQGKGSMSEFARDDPANVTSDVTSGGPLSI